MNAFSSIPLLFACQCAFVYAAARRAETKLWPVVLLLLCLALWGVASGVMANSGVYATERFTEALPGFWLPAVPIVLAGFLLVVSQVRNALLHTAVKTPHEWFIAIQGLRVTAVGTLIKTVSGDFPAHFEVAVGINDLAFGLSALPMYVLARSRRLSSDAAVLWHTTGIVIIVLPAGLAIELGMPGRLSYLWPEASSQAIFAFPMVLAPSLVVPGFLILSLLAIIGLVKQKPMEPNRDG